MIKSMNISKTNHEFLSNEKRENDTFIWLLNERIFQICFYRCDEFAKNSCWYVCFETFVDDFIIAQIDAIVDY